MTEYREPEYAASNTLPGMLQRGRGDGARLAVETGAVDEVMACVRTDYRWDWQVDSRPPYLARLVRDLGLPIAPIVTQLLQSPDPDDWNDSTNRFQVTCSILETLALDDGEARSALRDYVRDGAHWVTVLEGITVDWPRELWDDLYPVAMHRLTPTDVENLFLFSEPWSVWARERPELAALTAKRRAERDRDTARRRREVPVERLLATVRDADAHRSAKSDALFRLARTRVPLEILDLAESMTFRRGPDGDTFLTAGFARAVDALGAAALGHARDWTGRTVPGLSWLGLRTLARYGEHCDLPVLAAAVEDLIADEEDWCGYDTMFDGMIRLGLADEPDSAAARRAVDVLRWLWESTPHSHERTSYLRCLTAFRAADHQVVEGLWDCEEDVRRLAAESAPLTATVLDRLAVMRDDVLEADEVRGAAANRLA